MADVKLWTDSQAGPASYSSGGIVVTTTLTSVASFVARIVSAGANLGQCQLDVTPNSPGAGQATVKIMRENYDRLTAVGDVTGLPSGVTAATTSGQTYDTTSHTHTMDHNHAVTPASTTPAGANAATLAIALQPNVTTHTHTVDLPNFTGSMVAETAHTHTWDNIYQHQHVLTNTATDLAATEITAGTDLSGATLLFKATDG